METEAKKERRMRDPGDRSTRKVGHHRNQACAPVYGTVSAATDSGCGIVVVGNMSTYRVDKESPGDSCRKKYHASDRC